jgi:uncharacterized repeat protein (TIGR01451 family)
LQQGRISDTSRSFFAFPSIAVNRYDQCLIGYTRFGTNAFASANYTFVDPFGYGRADTTLKAGESSYTRFDTAGVNLWGKWSATTVDPLNDTEFWTIQEYAARSGNTTNLWGTWWGRISPFVALGINVEAAPNPVFQGSLLTYTITVINSGVMANGVIVTDTLPVGVSFSSALASQGSCFYTNGLVTCDLGSIDMYGFASVSVVIRPLISDPATNRVTVASNGIDGYPADNSASVVTTVDEPLTWIQISRTEANAPLLRFNSRAGHTYSVEMKAALDSSPWNVIATLFGTGEDLAFEDGTASGDMRFYRVRAD